MTTEHAEHGTAGHEHDEDGFTGEATLLIADTELPVRVELRGYFQPIDGRYHWYGRIAADERVDELVSSGGKAGRLRTPEGEADAKLSDRDPWGRFRIAGISTPPFAIDTADVTG